ncbi:unnamed protein product, partial [Brassica napus]
DRKSRHRRIKKQQSNELFTLLFHTRFLFSLSSS